MSTTTTVDRPFRADLLTLDPPRLLGSRCSACGTTTFPPRGFCPGCRSGAELETVPLTTEGRICSFTVVRQAPPGVEVPYVLAQVDLPSDEVRLMATVVGVAPERVALDQPVALELHPVGTADDGTTLLGYRFRAHPEEVAA
ncbi:Zn-ribbon domain-containing OB-fold protein [Actinomycetospora termitidis]|uniref:Zn-ribbon domain-containing OB-fold protein n=1 Tax=Actinomycetospora termitidis TaxID=3053470 RepID=A0ABT7M4J6_9PSEU|nr:Zn-ribbon domain-containing OB-fold protein [Actinomycetospora sp. Odt1-22]MDL5155603.1 Zn-ribbon domain-containing OB-fold protein [Actinomycetospora sp. Odt1-22]